MKYTYPEAIRELTPLFKSLTASNINRFNQRADSKIERRLGGKYAIPIRRTSAFYNAGTVSVATGTTSLVGVDTSFTTGEINGIISVSEGDMLYLINSRESVRIESIDSDTEITLSHATLRTATASQFFVVPSWLTTASEYETASLIIMKEFSKQAYNQETRNYARDFERMAQEEIEGAIMGNYYDDQLVKQSDAQSAARLVNLEQTESNLRADAFIREVNSSSFLPGCYPSSDEQVV